MINREIKKGEDGAEDHALKTEMDDQAGSPGPIEIAAAVSRHEAVDQFSEAG